MICKLCGKEVSDDALYCDGCGNSLREPDEGSVQPQPKTETIQPEQPSPEARPAGTQTLAGQPLAEEPGTGQLTFGQEPAQLTAERAGSAREEKEASPKAPPKIRSHMALAIVMTVIFGNWMLGIPAIVFARECEIAAEKEQWELARRFSGKALAFALVGVAVNLALGAFIALVVVVLAAAGPSILYW